MEHYEKVNRIISGANASFMSNAKWRKLIAAIEKSNIVVYTSHWKNVHTDHVSVSNGFPEINDLDENGIKDGRWSPLLFKEIHWVRIPRYSQNPQSDEKRHLSDVETNIKDLASYLSSVADFPLELTENYLEIKAYEL